VEDVHCTTAAGFVTEPSFHGKMIVLSIFNEDNKRDGGVHGFT